MDWTRGFEAGWSVSAVDQETWADAGQIDGVLSVSVSRDASEPRIETGTMTLSAGSFDWSWCRIYMTATQGGSERIPIATLLFERQSTVHGSGRSPRDLVSARGVSVLQPLADLELGRESYVPAGMDGAAYVGRLVGGGTPAPVLVEGSFTLVDDYVFDPDCTYLDAANALLETANWCMQIDGDGTVHVRAMPSEPALELSMANASLLVPGVGDDFSLIDVPNRLRVYYGGEAYTAENRDPSSEAGRPKRGRWVDSSEKDPVLVNGETAQMYAERRLAELSTVARTFSYEREHWPGVVPNSLVRAMLPGTGMEGDLRVVSQSLTCGNGVRISETSVQEVML